MIKLIPTSPDGAVSGGISSFTWSTSEQEWPFEKHTDGSTLYCRLIDCGTMPSAGAKFITHGISGLTAAKMFKLRIATGNSTDFLDAGQSWPSHDTGCKFSDVYIAIVTESSFYASNSFQAMAYLIYKH